MTDKTQLQNQSDRFQNKRIIVTGAASGIGKATALRLAQEGGKVWCTDVNAEGVEATAKEINEAGGIAIASVVDVTEASAATNLINEVVSQWEGLDILCNIAGIGGMTPFLEESTENFQRMIAVNLTGPFNLCLAAMPHLLESKGNILNLASSAGKIGQAYLSSYVSSKHGLVGLTKSLAMEFGRQGVRVNAVCPGAVNTPLIQNFRVSESIDFDLVNRYNFLDWFSEPSEVAGMIAYITSDEARYVNGAIMAIDGGITTG